MGNISSFNIGKESQTLVDHIYTCTSILNIHNLPVLSYKKRHLLVLTSEMCCSKGACFQEL